MAKTKRNLKKSLAVFLAAVLALSSMWCFTAFAAGDVQYIDENGNTQTASSYTSVASNSTAWSAGTYVADSNVTVSSRITVTGDVSLILVDGYTLTASDGINVTTGNSLTVYGQTAGTGTLTATSTTANSYAGIGGNPTTPDSGTVTINGGTVNATGTFGGAGIGGGYGGDGTVVINGGTVTAVGGDNINNNNYTYGSGIGAGQGGNANVTINGGTVTATGSERNAGIGGGDSDTEDIINITGGTITATGAKDSPGIGGGYHGMAGTINISGGTITATGGEAAAGIGGGRPGTGYEEGQLPDTGYQINISGGDITATGGSGGAGIGDGQGGTADYGTINISGGKITATGGSSGAGIGSGSQSGDGNITTTITDGYVVATGGRNGAGIGGGINTAGGTITISGGTVIAQSGNNFAQGTEDNGIGDGYNPSESLTPGVFSTGTNGCAVIYTNSISYTSNQNSWSGLISASDINGPAIVYGSPLTITLDEEIPSGKTAYIEGGKTLTIDSSASLTNYGTLYQDYTSTFNKNDAYNYISNTYYEVETSAAQGIITTGTSTWNYNNKLYALENATVVGSNVYNFTCAPYQKDNIQVLELTFTMPGEPVALTSSNIRTITYDANGLEGTAPDPTVINDPATTATLESGSSLTNFAGWNTKADGSGTHYDAGDTIDVKGDMILYAEKGEAHVHTLHHVNAKAPNCKEYGHEEYWYCEECGKFFADENGEKEIAEDSWILPMQHAMKSFTVSATCTEPGYTYYYCDNNECGCEEGECDCNDQGPVKVDGEEYYYMYSEEDETQPALGHNYSEEIDDSTGKYKYITFEWEGLEDAESLTDITCKATFTCTECGHEEVVECEISHNETGDTPATSCTDKGSYDIQASASVDSRDGETVTGTDDQFVEGVAKGHTYGTPEFNWSEDTENGTWSCPDATFTCSECEEGTDGHTVDVDCTVTTETTEPTCTAAGSTVYTATVEFNGETYTESRTVEIKEIGHDWDYEDARYFWEEKSEDDGGGYTCYALFQCKNDRNHEYGAICTVTDTTTPATCTEDGKIVYSASFTIKENEDDEGTTYTCNHTMETVIQATGHKEVTDEAVAPTCTEEGKTAGSHCSVCKEVLVEQEVIEAKGHTIDYEHPVYTVPATCEADGAAYYICECTDCGLDSCGCNTLEVTNDSGETVYYCESEVLTATGHGELTHVNAEAPTCENTGTSDYWQCETCKKMFSDPYANEELDADDIVVKATGHDWTGEITYDWEVNGDVVTCTVTLVCGNDSTHVATVTLSTENDEITVDTESVEGQITYSVEGTLTYGEDEEPVGTYNDSYTVEVEIGPCEHEDTIKASTEYPGAAATCTEDGYVTIYQCTECGAYFIEDPDNEGQYIEITYENQNDAVIAAHGHTYVEIGREAPTCLTKGYIFIACACTACGDNCKCNNEHYTFSNGDYFECMYAIELDAMGHNWGEPEFEWADDYTCTATITCQNDHSHTQVVECDVDSVTTEPSCTDAGETVYTATATFTINGDEVEYTDTATESLAALGHVYSNEKNADGTYKYVTFDWSDENADAEHLNLVTCEATFTCTECEHTETVKCTVEHTGDDDTAPSCTEAGDYDLVATAEIESRGGEPVTATDEDHIEGIVLGHDWGEPEFTWSSDNRSCTATITCQRDGCGKELTAICEVTFDITDPTCEEAGEVTYTATATFYDDDAEADVGPYTATKSVTGQAATGHDYDYDHPKYDWTQRADGSWTCSVTVLCNNDPSHEKELNVEVYIYELDPTCTEEGGIYYVATYEDEEGTPYTIPEVKVNTIDALGHDLEYVQPVAPTCTADGTDGYWGCTRCGAMFKDANAEEPTDEHEIVIPTNGHTYKVVGYVAPTCEDEGTLYYGCVGCDYCGVGENEACTDCNTEHDIYEDSGYEVWYIYSEPIPADGHTLVKVEAVAPSCTETGNKEYWECTVCGKLFSDAEGTTEISIEDTIIPANGHTSVEDPAVAPTCTDTGLTAGSHCEVCGEVLEAQEVVPALGHNYSVETDADGNYLYVEFNWCEDNDFEHLGQITCTATFTCTEDGCGHTETVDCIITYDEDVIPNCTDKGDIDVTATAHITNPRDGEALEASVDEHFEEIALGHDFDYASATFTWSDDYTTCTATAPCTRCEETDTIDCTVTSETTAATCTEDAYTVYTATFTADGKDYSETVTVTDEDSATGHDYDYDHPEYDWTQNADGSWVCSVTVLCKNNRNHDKALDVKLYVYTDPATCTEDGGTYYIATYEDEEGTPHTIPEARVNTIDALGHDLEYVQPVAPTCTADGAEGYWGCTRCGAMFADEDGTIPTDEHEIVVPTNGHNYKVVGYVAPTCEDEGTLYYGCVGCEYCEGCTADEPCSDCNTEHDIYKDTGYDVWYIYSEPIPANGHTLVKVEANDPTCTETGNYEYWECTVCGKLFFEEDGEYTETTLEETIIPANGHTLYKEDQLDPTCTKTGYEAYWKCSVCGAMFTDETEETELDAPIVIPAKNHNYSVEKDEITGEYLYVTFAWDEDNNDLQHLGQLTCKATFKCTDCDHTETVSCDVTWDEDLIPDCTHVGDVDVTATAHITNPRDDEPLTASIDEYLEEAVLGHAWGAPEFVWTATEDGYDCTATIVCGRCNEEITVTCKVESVTTDATCEEDGETVYTATADFSEAEEITAADTFTGLDDDKQATDTKTDVIPATGHNYAYPEFTWADDYSSCEATMSCQNEGCTESQTYECNVKSETTDPTCTKDGKIVYTATVDFAVDNNDQYVQPLSASIVKYTDTKEVTLDALGHDWQTQDEASIVWDVNGDDTTCTITIICKRGCGEELTKVLTIGDGITATITTEPGCETEGETTYTAEWTFTDDNKEEVGPYTSSATEAIEPTGHDWDVENIEYTWVETEEGYDCTASVTCNNGHVSEFECTVTSETTDPTCTEDGEIVYTATVTIDGNEYTDVKTVGIDALGHTEGEAVIENVVDATCTEKGSYDKVIYCEVCGEELSRDSFTTDALGHTPGEKEYVEGSYTEQTDAEDGSVDWVIRCTVCGEVLESGTEVIPANGHTPGEKEYDEDSRVEPTETEDGSIDWVIRCTECGEILETGTDVIPATGVTGSGSTSAGGSSSTAHSGLVAVEVVDPETGETYTVYYDPETGIYYEDAEGTVEIDPESFILLEDYEEDEEEEDEEEDEEEEEETEVEADTSETSPNTGASLAALATTMALAAAGIVTISRKKKDEE